MADAMYVAMSGAVARAEQLDSISDNLANANTVGFKAERPAFSAVLASSQAKDKAYVSAVATSVDLRPGPLQHTQAPLDVTPEGQAFLQVQTGAGVAWTRNGHLALGPDGLLTAGGNPVLSTQGTPLVVPIVNGAMPTPEIRPDGSVWAAGVAVGTLATFTLSGQLSRVGNALYAPVGAGGAATPVQARVQVGQLELGNATPLEAAVQLVGAQRHYELATQALQTYRRLDEKANDMGRVR